MPMLTLEEIKKELEFARDNNELVGDADLLELIEKLESELSKVQAA